MLEAAVKVVKSPTDLGVQPILLELKSSRVSAILLMVLLLPALAAIFIPLILVVAQASEAAAVLAENPGSMVQLLAGFVLWTGLFVVPVARLLAHFGARRQVKIENGFVSIVDKRLLGRFIETMPLTSYDGIVHRVRTTLSGTHHELLLVKCGQRGGVMFYSADRIGPETIAKAASTLGLPVIPAADAKRRRVVGKTDPANDTGPAIIVPVKAAA